MIHYRLSEAQRAANAEADNCQYRSIPVYKKEYNDWTGETDDVLTYESRCNWVAQGVKTDKCHRCGKIYTYP